MRWLTLAIVIGGGCGGGPEFELSTDTLVFSAAHTCDYPPSQEVTATVRKNGNGSRLYIVIVYDGRVVGSISDFRITSGTMGKASVIPASAASLGSGVFTGTIIVHACVDDPTCATGELTGSPRRIDVRYEIGGPGIMDDPSLYTLSHWELATQNPPFGGDFRLAPLGFEPHAVASASDGTLSVYRSGDYAMTWQRLPAAANAYATKDFAVVGTDTAIYVSGGTTAAGLETNQVLKFEDGAWTQKTAAAAFPPRARHAMVRHEGRLYVLGGRARGAFLDDVWASDDDGVTWTDVATTRFTPRYDHCAASLGGALYVIGGTGNPTELWRSTDGVVWSRVALPANSPFVHAAYSPAARCGVLGERLYLIGTGRNSTCLAASVSTANGLDWQFEGAIELPDDGMTPGAAVAGGRIYVVGLQQRSVYRSVP
jgi:hypothetical protein